MTFKIVILSATASNLVPCVQAILSHEPDLPPDHIIVVDDGARPDAEAQLPPVQWVTGLKPFIFARNANLGIRAAADDVILLNDDACLDTPQGFTQLAQLVKGQPHIGVCSAGIRGLIGNPRQLATSQRELRFEDRTLAFVCVYIPKAVYDRIGPLDERFDGYGFDDNDYCDRVRAAGLRLAIWDGCVVDHTGALPSTFRTRSDLHALFQHNRQLYHTRQPILPATAERCVDLLYLARNRLEFTRETFSTLIINTDWQFVNELVVYDDGSEDGTCEWLEDAIGRVPAPVRFARTRFGSPVAAMSHFIEAARAPILAKTDNDAMLPPAWLKQSLAVLNRHPELMLLGIEAMYPHQDEVETTRTYTPAEFISGLGLYRRAAFARSRPTPYNKYFGLEEWQVAQGARLTRGWITPALPVFLLDRFPLEPWLSLSANYEQHGWQRSWPKYDRHSTLWHWRWPPDAAPTPIPVEPPRTPVKVNLGCIDTPLAGYENVGRFVSAGITAVDLQQPWPWGDESVDQIQAADVLEHLPDKIFTMNELWRILRPGGLVEIVVPATDGTGAWQDPTHVSYWNRRSFLYYEAGNPYRERFAQRYGIRAQFRTVSEQTEQTLDGPRLTIKLQAVKATSDRPLVSVAAADTARPAADNLRSVAQPDRPALPDGDARFAGALRIKNEAEHIQTVIASLLPLCQRVFVFDDHSIDDTVSLCRSFGDRVTVFESPFQGLDEARDKNYLLEKIIAANPAWVVWIDGDEVLEAAGPARLRAAADAAITVYSLQIAYMWDDPQHVRVDGIFGRFARPSVFKLSGQPVQRLRFPVTRQGGNFHCGNVPRGLIGAAWALNVRLKHFGYMSPAQRQAKYNWYRTHDPNNVAEDNYRHLAGLPGARHAPGPPHIVPWTE